MHSASTPSSPFSVALFGAGSVGAAVAYLLRRCGHEVAWVASRSPESAERASRLLGAPAIAIGHRPPRRADVVLLGVPEPAIETAARRVADLVGPGDVVCHFAGVAGIEPLNPAGLAGAGMCALHPVQACPDVATAIERLPGSAWGVTTTLGMEQWAARLVERDLAGTAVPVSEGDRPVWHAAAVTVSNGMAALWELGASMLQAIGTSAPGAVLAPLATGTLANLSAAPPRGALTGPVVRGEATTVRRHLDALDARAPEASTAYAAAVRLMSFNARRAGRLDDASEAAIERVLEGR